MQTKQHMNNGHRKVNISNIEKLESQMSTVPTIQNATYQSACCFNLDLFMNRIIGISSLKIWPFH